MPKLYQTLQAALSRRHEIPVCATILPFAGEHLV